VSHRDALDQLANCGGVFLLALADILFDGFL
jgi:hypothetical protein